MMSRPFEAQSEMRAEIHPDGFTLALEECDFTWPPTEP
jgi:hypothetical protein